MYPVRLQRRQSGAPSWHNDWQCTPVETQLVWKPVHRDFVLKNETDNSCRHFDTLGPWWSPGLSRNFFSAAVPLECGTYGVIWYMVRNPMQLHTRSVFWGVECQAPFPFRLNFAGRQQLLLRREGFRDDNPNVVHL